MCRWELKLKEQTRAQTACADGTDAAKDGAGRRALEGDCDGGVRESAERQERGMSFRAERTASRFKWYRKVKSAMDRRVTAELAAEGH